jgi:hypothetical protein
MATARSVELRLIAAVIAEALPSIVEEVVLTGSVSRGVADELSDIEMLVVTTRRLGLAECFEHARSVGLVDLDTWGVQGTEVTRVFGYYEGVPVESIWWRQGLCRLYRPCSRDPPCPYLQAAATSRSSRFPDSASSHSRASSPLRPSRKTGLAQTPQSSP